MGRVVADFDEIWHTCKVRHSKTYSEENFFFRGHVSGKSAIEFSDHDPLWRLLSPKLVKMDRTNYIFLKRGHSRGCEKNIFRKNYPTKFFNKVENRGKFSENPSGPNFFFIEIIFFEPIFIQLSPIKIFSMGSLKGSEM